MAKQKRKKADPSGRPRFPRVPLEGWSPQAQKYMQSQWDAEDRADRAGRPRFPRVPLEGWSPQARDYIQSRWDAEDRDTETLSKFDQEYATAMGELFQGNPDPMITEPMRAVLDSGEYAPNFEMRPREPGYVSPVPPELAQRRQGQGYKPFGMVNQYTPVPYSTAGLGASGAANRGSLSYRDPSGSSDQTYSPPTGLGGNAPRTGGGFLNTGGFSTAALTDMSSNPALHSWDQSAAKSGASARTGQAAAAKAGVTYPTYLGQRAGLLDIKAQNIYDNALTRG